MSSGDLFAQNASAVTFSSTEHGFIMKMPYKPTVSKDSISVRGQYIYTTDYQILETDGIYSVTCSEFSAWELITSKRQTLSVLKEMANPKMGGEIVELKEIVVDGNYGLKYTETSGIAGAYNIYNQLLFVDGTIFQMYVTSLTKDAKDEAEEFYENFTLH